MGELIAGETMALPYTRCVAQVRPPQLTRLLALGQPPDILTPVAHSAVYQPLPKGWQKPPWERQEDARLYLETLRVVCTDVLLSPRVVDKPKGDDQIHIEELPLRTRAFLLDYATAPAYRWLDFCADKRRMWQVWQRATTYHLLPSAILNENDTLTAWMLDSAITFFGIVIDNALGETTEQGMGNNKKSVAKYKLPQLLEAKSPLPRSLPEVQKPASGFGGIEAIMALAGQPGSGVKMWKYVPPQ